jgi:hypothetical protein
LVSRYWRQYVYLQTDPDNLTLGLLQHQR